jgi:hypothetical protein
MRIPSRDSLVAEPVTTACATSLQCVLPVFRAHANPKPVGLLLVAVVGLERAFHGLRFPVRDA